MRGWRSWYFGRSNGELRAVMVAVRSLPRQWLAIGALMLAGSAPLAAVAQTITDGDTLKMGGATYRLWGIDAPEAKQECPDGWPAGRMATTRLLALTTGKRVDCQEKDRDRYGRVVAICRVSGEDLGAILVREGFAWAFTRYSNDYVSDEARARSAKVGVHAHSCLPAWEWRTQQRR